MTFTDVIAPMSLEEFLRDYVSKRYVVLSGSPRRFKQLAPWSMLNATLSRLRVNDNRVVLVKNGKALPRNLYVHTSASGCVEYLNGAALVEHIADGASLVINQVDELLPDVRELAEACENIFRNYVSANLYAGWRTANAFDVHWDEHDTLIVQVTGHKDWKVWPPTKEHPLRQEAPEAPSGRGEPVWHGTLREGDTLYMPRGWWHVAHPRDEPSIHITFALTHKTGADVLGWLSQRFQELPFVRQDFPQWADTNEQRRWLDDLRAACLDAWTDSLAAQFNIHSESRAHARPIICLPQTSTGRLSLNDHSRLRLVAGRRLVIERRDASPTITFTVGATLWQCPAGLMPALEMLNHIMPCSIAMMTARVHRDARGFLRPFILAMLASNAIWAEPCDSEMMTNV